MADVGTHRPQTARLELLGVARLVPAGGVAQLLERKDAALLAMLALEGPTPRDRLAAMLWPDTDNKAARSSLRQRRFRLKHSAGWDLIAGSDTLALAEGIDVDVTLHLQASDLPQVHAELLGSHDYGDCAELCAWVDGARQRWRRQRSRALQDLVESHARAGRIAPALQCAARWAVEDPTSEPAHRQLMRLHSLRGDHAAALQAYRRLCGELARQLGVGPDAETSALAARIGPGTAGQASPPSSRSPGLLRPPRLVGREPAWARLEEGLDRGDIVLLAGEPGIGKSRLLSDFAATRGDVPVLAARPGDRTLPFALGGRMLRMLAARFGMPPMRWVRAELARLAPELGAPLAGSLDLLRVVEAFARLLEQARAAGLQALAIDDMHFADDASLELLLGLLADDAGRALRWLLGVRPGEMPPLLRQWLESHAAGAVWRVELDPLDARATEQLVASLTIPGMDAVSMGGPLWRHTGGNPLFILETVRTMLAQGGVATPAPGSALPVADNVGELIARRLALLSSAARRLAHVAAVAGQHFGIELAAHALGAHVLDLAEAWSELDAAHVFRDGVFAHDLVAEAALRGVPGPIARSLHASVAVWLDRHAAPPGVVAAHWAAADDPARAAEAFVRAARDARTRSRRVDEVHCWEAAAGNLQRLGRTDEVFAARRESIESVLLVHGAELAKRVAGELVAASKPDSVQRVDALIARAHVLLMAIERDAAMQDATQALELAERLALAPQRIDATQLLALALTHMRRVDDAAQRLARVDALVERDGTLRQRYDYWSARAYVLLEAGHPRRSAVAGEKAIELAQSLGDIAEVMINTSNLAQFVGLLGRFEEAVRLLEQALRLREELGALGGIPAFVPHINLGVFLGLLGRYREALQQLEEALAGLRAAGSATWIALAENHLAATFLFLGDVTRARKALASGVAGVLPSTRARRCVLEARVERALGRSGAPHVARAFQALDEGDDRLIRMLAQLEQARDLDAPAAAQQYDSVRAAAEESELDAPACRAGLLHAEALLQLGQPDRAAVAVRDILARIDRVRPNDMYFAEAWWIAFRSFDAAGDAEAARAALQAAVDWIHGIALPNVPETFRDSFLDRNPVNRVVLTTASRRLKVLRAR
jgi:DNA-binding SARP family transcriptional activator